MSNLSRSIATAYVRFKHKDSSVRFMIRICFIGIFIGTFSLMMTLIIMNGFEKTIHEKMQGINADITIFAPLGEKLDPTPILNILATNFPDTIASASPSLASQIIIDKDKKQSLVMLKGVNPTYEHNTTRLHHHVDTNLYRLAHAVDTQKKQPTPVVDLSALLHDNQIIVGYKLAQQFNLNVGDVIKILVPESGKSRKISLHKQKATVAGFFKIGLDEYDQGVAFGNLSFVQSILDEEQGVDSIALKVSSKVLPLWQRILPGFIARTLVAALSSTDNIVKNLRTALPGLIVSSWQELYPAVVSSLKLEKYVSFFILLLITLVASLNMISLLFLQIQQKRRDVAILLAMGMPRRHIRNIFLWIGLLITIIASLCGLACAAIGGYVLERYPFIELPDVYYVSHIPARMDLEIFITVFVCTFLLGLIATLIPTQRIKYLNITHVLRNE